MNKQEQAFKAYKEAEGLASKNYDEAKELALKIYNEIEEPALKKYMETMLLVLKAYHEAMIEEANKGDIQNDKNDNSTHARRVRQGSQRL